MSYSTPIQAQVSAGGTPISFTSSIPQNIHTASTLPVNVDSLLVEDEREAAEGMPFRFGYGFDVEYSLYNSGTWIDLPDGGGGTIHSTKDGGETWEKNKLAVTPAPFLTSIQFVDLKHGWTGSRDDWLGFFRTTDGGSTWIQRSWESLRGFGVQNFFFLDSLNGWLSTFPGRPYEICKTTDGGKTWDFY